MGLPYAARFAGSMQNPPGPSRAEPVQVASPKQQEPSGT